MGAEVFDLDWIKSIVQFFSYLGWSLFIVGIVVAVFDAVIEAQSGKPSFRDLGINGIKAFIAANLFTIVPVELYKLTVTLQSSLGSGIS